MSTQDIKGRSRSLIRSGQGELSYFRLGQIQDEGIADISSLPFSIRLLVENALRNMDGYLVTEADVLTAAKWNPSELPTREFPFMPSRVLMQLSLIHI